MVVATRRCHDNVDTNTPLYWKKISCVLLSWCQWQRNNDDDNDSDNDDYDRDHEDQHITNSNITTTTTTTTTPLATFEILQFTRCRRIVSFVYLIVNYFEAYFSAYFFIVIYVCVYGFLYHFSWIYFFNFSWFYFESNWQQLHNKRCVK